MEGEWMQGLSSSILIDFYGLPAILLLTVTKAGNLVMKIKLAAFICTFFTAVNRLFAQQPGTQLWVFNDVGLTGVTTAPAVAPDGTIYFSASGSLLALTPAGSNKWTFTPTSGLLYGSPTVGLDGTVYFGELTGTIYALNPDASTKWTTHH
jgi:outer membrane protein assembly factor BamB